MKPFSTFEQKEKKSVLKSGIPDTGYIPLSEADFGDVNLLKNR